MKNFVEEMDYETPQVKMIVVEIEKGFAASDGESDGNGEGNMPGGNGWS